MPVSLASGAAAGWISAVPTLAGIGAGGLVAALLVSVSLFLVPPE
jgi:threonine/homoserine/homoserine lactone efflux protein